MPIPNLNMGPLDPETTAEFGVVAGPRNARELLRHHRDQYPPQLLSALRRRINDPRTQALDPDEVEAAALAYFERYEHDVPEGFEVVGASVHGGEGTRQFVGVTFRVATGRTAKLAVPYSSEEFGASMQAGAAQVEIDRARKAGLPILPHQLAGLGYGAPAPAPEGVSDEQVQEKVDAAVDAALGTFAEKLADALIAKGIDPEVLAEAAASAEDDALAAAGDDDDGGDQGDGDEGDLTPPPATTPPPASTEGEGAEPGLTSQQPPEPWEGYRDLRVSDVRERLRTATHDEARAVIAFEQSPDGQARAGVITAANAVLDAPPVE